MKASKVTSTLAAGVLFLGIAIVGIGETRVSPQRFNGRLAELLPRAAEVPGWKVEDRLPVESPELARIVQESLAYNEAVYADYVQGALRISVYMAYWEPRRISSQWVASHTPDVCWVQGHVEDVLFCHIVDGQVTTFNGEGERPSRLRDFLNRLRSGRGGRPDAEQFFVRISSNYPATDFVHCAPVEFIVARLIGSKGVLTKSG